MINISISNIDDWISLITIPCPGLIQYLLHVYNKLINKCDRYNETPLHFASGFGHIDCIEILLSDGADCEMKDIAERTAYVWVCEGES